MKSIPKQHLLSLCASAFLVLASMQFAYAAESASFPDIIGDDFEYIASAPSRWEAQDRKNLVLATLSVAGISFLADRPVRDYMRQQPRGNSFLNTMENFGQTYALGVMGGFYLAGIATDDEKSVQVAQDLVAASLVSATINQTLKTATSRSRPRDNKDIYYSQGYTGLVNNSSFPSGHTTEAFTLASVIAESYDEAWVSYTAYSVAGLVGVARMYNDAHFASDVTASAIIGTLVGKTIVQHNRTLRSGSKKLVFLPMLGSDFTGMQVVGNF